MKYDEKYIKKLRKKAGKWLNKIDPEKWLNEIRHGNGITKEEK